MTDLTEFLLARIEHEEFEARQFAMGSYVLGLPLVAAVARVKDDDELAAVRVLAECAAKRQIVEDCSRAIGRTSLAPDASTLAIAVLAALATPYADHPDYRAEWAL